MTVSRAYGSSQSLNPAFESFEGVCKNRLGGIIGIWFQTHEKATHFETYGLVGSSNFNEVK